MLVATAWNTPVVVVGAAEVVSLVDEDELRLLLELEEDFDELLLLDVVLLLAVFLTLDLVEDVVVRAELVVFELDFEVVAFLLLEEEDVRR